MEDYQPYSEDDHFDPEEEFDDEYWLEPGEDLVTAMERSERRGF